MQGDSEIRPRFELAFAALLGLSHLVVEAACIGLLVWGKAAGSFPDDAIWGQFFLYNLLAFGTQFSIGTVLDGWKAYRAGMLIGLAMIAVAVTGASFSPQTAVVLAALGNSAFHVGSGAFLLNRSPSRTAAVGLFVGPGAVGLAIGAWCASSAGLDPWMLLGPLVLCASAVLAVSIRSEPTDEDRPVSYVSGTAAAVACVTAMVIVVAVRSFGPHSTTTLYNGQIDIVWGLALAACVGNVLGGFASDRFGWLGTCVLAILVSAPLLSYWVDDETAAIAGTMLFQMTMPVTLAAIGRVFPREPGLAFGLAALGVLIGVVPVYVCPPEWITAKPLLFILSLVSLAAVLVGLPPQVRQSLASPRAKTTV